jgi:hypothetical protein
MVIDPNRHQHAPVDPDITAVKWKARPPVTLLNSRGLQYCVETEVKLEVRK